MKKEDVRLAIMQQRIKHNMNQTQLAEKLGVSQRSISLWENGEVLPRNTTCIKLAQVFNMPIDYFIIDKDGDEVPDPQSAPAQNPEINDAVNKLLQHYGDIETVVTYLKGMDYQK